MGKFYGQAQATRTKILRAFEDINSIPKRQETGHELKGAEANREELSPTRHFLSPGYI